VNLGLQVIRLFGIVLVIETQRFLPLWFFWLLGATNTWEPYFIDIK
jgi:hypothetical protein